MTTKTLVEQLRRFHAEIVECDEGRESEQMKMTREAADEIERLQEVLRRFEAWKSECDRPIAPHLLEPPHCSTCECTAR